MPNDIVSEFCLLDTSIFLIFRQKSPGFTFTIYIFGKKYVLYKRRVTGINKIK